MGLYLGAALREFSHQILALPVPGEVEICVSDNASEDSTEQLMAELCSTLGILIVYFRRMDNHGPDSNYMDVVKLASGQYCWLFGADDVATPGAVARVLNLVDTTKGDIFLHERIECDVALTPLKSSGQIVRVPEAMCFDTDNPRNFNDFVDRANNIGALFSYLSSIVVRKSIWDGAPINNLFIGSGYSHAQRICAAVKAGANLVCTPEKNVYCRLGNDSFLVHDAPDRHARRILLDIRGYTMIAVEVFGTDKRSAAVLDVLRRTHPNPFQTTIVLCESLSAQMIIDNARWISSYAGGWHVLKIAQVKIALARIKARLLNASNRWFRQGK